MLPEGIPSLPPKPKEELTPTGLVTAWKKSGEFDQLRKRLLQEFLASGDKAELVAQLDSILPRVLESAVPPISRIPRKDRPSHVLDTLDRDPTRPNPLDPNLARVKLRLTTQRDHESVGLGRTIERQLRNCRRKYYDPDCRDIQLEPDSREAELTTGEPNATEPLASTGDSPDALVSKVKDEDDAENASKPSVDVADPPATVHDPSGIKAGIANSPKRELSPQ